jgi:hypothetical protein
MGSCFEALRWDRRVEQERLTRKIEDEVTEV